MGIDDCDRATNYVIVFNCLSCGTLLSCDSGQFCSTATCPNCGAYYGYDGTHEIIRYGKGRPPTQWKSAGYDPEEEKQKRTPAN